MSAPEVPVAQQSADIGQFFMVDHYGMSDAGFADVRAKIVSVESHRRVGETLRTMIRGYSDLAHANGRDELFGGKDSSGAATSFAGIGFHGLTVSDALWTWGATKGSTALQRQRLMARAFLAGIDILMVAKTDFSGAWTYLPKIYANMLPVAEQHALMAATGYTSWNDLRAAFRARITESVAHIRSVKSALGRSTTFMKTGPARHASSDLVGEYRQLAI